MELPCFVDVHNQYIYINSERDLCDLIEKHCGHEVANIVATICNSCTVAQAYAKQRIYADIAAYEAELDEWEAELSEWENVGTCIEETLSEYEEYDACHKNLNRDKINEMKTKIRSLLNEVM